MHLRPSKHPLLKLALTSTNSHRLPQAPIYFHGLSHRSTRPSTSSTSFRSFPSTSASKDFHRLSSTFIYFRELPCFPPASTSFGRLPQTFVYFYQFSQASIFHELPYTPTDFDLLPRACTMCFDRLPSTVLPPAFRDLLRLKSTPIYFHERPQYMFIYFHLLLYLDFTIVLPWTTLLPNHARVKMQQLSPEYAQFRNPKI